MADLKLVRRDDFTSLRNRIAKVLHQRFGPSLGAAQCGWDREPKATKDMYREDADAVIAELTAYLPPIFASAIHAYADSQLAAMSHHGHPEAIWEMERLKQHAASIANYATTHEKWRGKADDE